MAVEIERKFLVTSDEYKSMATSHHSIVQGYLNRDPERTVRIRLMDGRAFITVKGLNHGCRRNEWEYPVPASDARQMLELCEGVIHKTRWMVPATDGLTWEVDEFAGAHEGMVVAEIELPEELAEVILPHWVGAEVTGDPRYYNSALSADPV